MSTEIRVSGMHCDGCVRRLQKALAAVVDVKVIAVAVGLVEVDLVTPAARQKAEEAIAAAGYRVDG